MSAFPGPGPSPYWQGRRELRADLRGSLVLGAVLAALGVPAGVLWWLLAPRADFDITADGPVPVGEPAPELLVADDVVFAFVVAVVGLGCGAAAWWLRGRRGVGTVLALAAGTSALAVVAWQVGELLGAGPTEAELGEVGLRVTTALDLASPPALAVAPFMALLAYLVATLYTADDGLGRTGAVPVPGPGADVPEPPRPLAGVPSPPWDQPGSRLS